MIDNYKLAIITSNSIKYRGDFSDSENHMVVMKKYGIEEYGADSVFGFFDDEYTFNIFEYYLASYQNIIFYNLTNDDNKFGILVVLDYINEFQNELVNHFLDSLNGFTVEFDSYLTVDGKLTMNDPIEESFDECFVKIRKYFKKNTINKRKNKGF